MTRGVYLAWMAVLLLAIAISSLPAAVGTWLRLQGAETVACADVAEGRAPSIRGHVRLRGCVIDRTEAIATDDVAWVPLRSPTVPSGPPIAWVRRGGMGTLQWALHGRELSDEVRRRFQERHPEWTTVSIEVEGWARAPEPGSRFDAPLLSGERPLEPLAVGGGVAAGLFLALLLFLMRYRARHRERQLQWARETGVPTSRGDAPRTF